MFDRINFLYAILGSLFVHKEIIKKKRDEKKNSWVVSKVISIKNYRLLRLKRANKLIKASAA